MKVPDRSLRFRATALALVACASAYVLAAASLAPPLAYLTAAPRGQVIPLLQAVTPPKFKLDAGAIFYTLKPDVAERFETLIGRLALAQPPAAEKLPNPRKPADRWRVFRMREPLASGNLVYLSFVDSPDPDVEYSLARIFRERLPAEPPETFTSLLDGVAGTVVTANYRLIADFAAVNTKAGPPRASSRPPAGRTDEAAPNGDAGCPSTDSLAAWSIIAAGAPALMRASEAAAVSAAVAAPDQPFPAVNPRARCFSAGTGMLFYYVKGDRTEDFEILVGRLRAALVASDRPERRAQAGGWRVFRQAEPRGTHGVVTYLFVIDPAVPKANYALSEILGEAFPAEAQQLLSTYNSTNADGMSLANLRLVGELK